MFVAGALLVLVPIGIGLLVLGAVLRARRAQRDAAEHVPD
jgi:cytochrome c biogenesis protein CcdA